MISFTRTGTADAQGVSKIEDIELDEGEYIIATTITIFEDDGNQVSATPTVVSSVYTNLTVDKTAPGPIYQNTPIVDNSADRTVSLGDLEGISFEFENLSEGDVKAEVV